MNYLFRYLIFPNIVFGILATIATPLRALINIDYCLIGICSPFIGRYWAATLYCAFFVLDIVVSFAPTYHLKPVIILSMYREILAFSPIYILLLLLLFVTPLLCMWYLTFKRELISSHQKDLRWRSVLIIVPLCLMLLDILNGTNIASPSKTVIFRFNIAGSALARVYSDIMASGAKRIIPQKQLGQNEYAMSGVFSDIKANKLPHHNIVLVIVESWGISKDAYLNQALAASLTNSNILSRYQVRSTTVPFMGSTVPAELRELCARRDSDPDNVASIKALPAILAEKGYETVALHGFMPLFFGRKEWYPEAGFHTSLFIDDIDKMQFTHERCGSTAFRGICDDSVPPLIKQLLMKQTATNAPKFIYWLTLNSHYPFVAPDHPSRFVCNDFNLSSTQQDVCNLSSTLNSTFESLSKLVMDSDISTTRFIFVGDHAPPFLMRSNEGLYDKDNVPMIELLPKKQEIVR